MRPWRRFSQEVSSCDAILDALHFCTFFSLHCARNHRFFIAFGLFWCKISNIFPHVWPHCLFAGFSLFWCKLSWVFPDFCPSAPNILGFFIGFSSSDANLLQSFHFLGPIVQESSGSYRFSCIFLHLWPHCTRNPRFFTGFSLFFVFPQFWPCCTKNPWIFHKSFLFWCKLSHLRIQTCTPWCQQNL